MADNINNGSSEGLRIKNEIINNHKYNKSDLVVLKSQQSICHVCKRSLGVFHGHHICPKCQHHFCIDHWNTNQSMKLHGLTHQWDPVHGQLTTVCSECFYNRPGYNGKQLEGSSTKIFERFQTFKKMTRSISHSLANNSDILPPSITVDLCSGLNKLRLENRLLKLTRIYQSNILDKSEQLVPWSKNRICCICNSNLRMKKRHHCRLCGKMTCVSTQRSCSISLQIPKTDNRVWICSSCDDQLNSTFKDEKLSNKRSSFLSVYNHYRASRINAEHQYQEMLNFQDHNHDRESHISMILNDIEHLLHDMIQFARNSNASLSFKQLVSNVCTEGTQWLHSMKWNTRSMHRKASSTSNLLFGQRIPLSHFMSLTLSTPKPEEKSPSLISSLFSSIRKKKNELDITPLDPEYRNLLIEQRIQLEDHVHNAVNERNFDHIGPLREAIDEIDRQLRREFEQV